MGIKQDLMGSLKIAMKVKDTLKKDTITMLRAAILQVEKDEQRELSETDIQVIVAKEIKKRKESISDYEKGQRPDIVEQINKEVEILSEYLPEQLSKDEITQMVLEAINITESKGPKDMGKVMSSLKDKTSGRADGKAVSDIVKIELGKL